jgi:hypothetical protein
MIYDSLWTEVKLSSTKKKKRKKQHFFSWEVNLVHKIKISSEHIEDTIIIC